MTPLLKIIHRPCCEQFHVGTTFLLTRTTSTIYFHYIWEKAEISTADNLKIWQLTTLSIYHYYFGVNCPFKVSVCRVTELPWPVLTQVLVDQQQQCLQLLFLSAWALVRCQEAQLCHPLNVLTSFSNWRPVGAVFSLLSVMHLLRRHSFEKTQPGYVFGDIYIRQCFSFA